MRTAAQKKLGFYATPQRITEMIRSRLDFSLTRKLAALDPCAGEGEALAQIFDCITPRISRRLYGIELDAERAIIARTRLDSVIHSSLEESTVNHSAFSLLWLNPPYDNEHLDATDAAATGKKTERKEITFLRRTLPFLAPAGVLVYIVPAHIFKPETIHFLSSKLDNLEIWRFPEPERSEFNQAIAIGTRSSEKRLNPPIVPILETIPSDREPHRVPDSNPQVKIFRTHALNPVELAGLANNSALMSSLAPDLADLERLDRRPPLALHNGHLSLLIASGCIDGVLGEAQDKHLLKGKTRKYVNTTRDESYNDETGSTTKTTRHRDAYSVSIKILRECTGEIYELTAAKPEETEQENAA